MSVADSAFVTPWRNNKIHCCCRDSVMSRRRPTLGGNRYPSEDERGCDLRSESVSCWARGWDGEQVAEVLVLVGGEQVLAQPLVLVDGEQVAEPLVLVLLAEHLTEVPLQDKMGTYPCARLAKLTSRRARNADISGNASHPNVQKQASQVAALEGLIRLAQVDMSQSEVASTNIAEAAVVTPCSSRRWAQRLTM
jgi:hypothetical protein